MSVLMTLASVLAAALLLSVLCVGLLLIVKPLQSARGYLEQIAMGVRAIETHVTSLPSAVGDLTERAAPLGDRLGRAAERLDVAGRALETVRTDRAD